MVPWLCKKIVGEEMARRHALGLSLLVGLIIAFAGVVFPSPIYAEPTGRVELSIEADRDAYEAGETATFTLTVQNASDSDIADVVYAVTLPEEMELVEGSNATGSVASLASGDTYTAMLQARVLAPTSASASISIPQTGDSALATIVACVGGAVLCGSAAFFVRRRNGGAAVMLVIALAIAGSWCIGGPNVAYAADAGQGTTNASCDISVAGQMRTVEVSVSYTVSTGGQEEPDNPDEEFETMTRAEWISKLLDGTGAIDLDTNAEPYSDISGHAAEPDIKTAWVLGILPDDAAAFEPDAVATRDFVYSVAALAADADTEGKVLETPDAADSEHPELLAAAIDAGLLATDSEGRINPASSFDAREAEALIRRIVEYGTRGDEEPQGAQEQASFEYRRDVQVFRTYTSLANGSFMVDGASGLVTGDRVVLEASDGLQGSMLGTVSSVAPMGEAAVIAIEPASDPSEFFSSIALDVQNLAIDSSQMELAEGVAFSDAPTSRSVRNGIEIDTNTDLTIGYPESGEGDFTVKASLSIQPYVNADWVWNPLFAGPRRFELGFGAKTTFRGTVDASIDDSVSVPLFTADVAVPIPGFSVGVNVDMVFTAEGHVELTATLDSEAGMKYNRVIGLEPYGGFDSDAKLELNAAFRAGISPWVSLDFMTVSMVDGTFAAGIDGSGATIVRDTGLICNDTSLYAYARAALGENSPVFQWIDDAFDLSLSYDLWDEDSSPFSERAHWENGVLVDSCTYHEGGSGEEGGDGGTGTGVIDPNFDGIPAQEDEGLGYEPNWTVSDNNHEEIVEPFYIDTGRSITVTAQEGCNYRGMFGSSGNTLVRRTVAFEDGEVITDLMQGVFMYPWDSTDVSTVTLDVLVGRLKVWNLEGWGTDPLSGETFAARPVYSLNDCGKVAYPVSLSATVVTVGVGGSYKLEAQQGVESVYESEGCDYTHGAQWSWKSDDPRIASIDDNGEISGIAPGTTYITVTFGKGTMGFDRICKVIVTE